MSGAQPSGFANQLFDPMMAIHQQEGQNQLLQQQQDIGSHEMEMAGRLAGTLLSQYQTPEARAAAYPTLLANARALAPGYFKNAPSTYPGDDVTHALALAGTPSQTQAEWAQNLAANKAYSNANTPPAAPAAGGAAAPAAPAAPGATIGQRQNNPGNLTFAGQPYASPGQGNRFASFPDMATGVAANADQLSLYQTQHGINTVRGAVTRWVGDPKADLTSYVGDIAKSLGVGPDDKIDLTDPAVQAKFIQAQFPHESAGGGYVLNPADVAKGVQMAAARRGQQVQPTPPAAVAAVPGAPAAPGATATPAPYRVAGAMQPPPGTTVAPGQAAPAPGQPAAPGGAASAQPPAPTAPPGAPAPPQLAQLNENGLQPMQQRQINAMRDNPQTKPHELIAQQQAFVNQNIQLQQKQFSDWIQTQQLATSQGQLTVAQQNSALEYWKAAHPDAKVTLTGGEIITQDPRDGHEIAPRIKVTPNQAPRFTEGEATWDGQQWVQTRPGQHGVPGKWGVGPGGEKFYPASTEPAQADYANAVEDVRHDRGEIDSIGDAGRAGQQDNIRVQEMRNILQSTDTGHGSETNAMIRAYIQRWAPEALTGWTKDYANLTGPAAVEMFQKLGFMGATSQEKGVTSRGGYQATRLFQQFNPGAQLLTATNQGLLAQHLISNQADVDYSQAAQDFYVNQRARFKSPERGYDSLAVFNQQWQQQRNPQVYAGAIGALGGQDAEQWARGLSKDEVQRVKDIVTRADPNAMIHMPGEGFVPLQPNAKPIPQGWKPAQ